MQDGVGASLGGEQLDRKVVRRAQELDDFEPTFVAGTVEARVVVPIPRVDELGRAVRVVDEVLDDLGWRKEKIEEMER